MTASAVVSVAARRIGRCASSIAPRPDEAKSDDDDAAASWATARGERSQDGPRVEGEVPSQGISANGKSQSVASCVGDDEEDMLDRRVIAELEHHAALECLKVGEPRFDLERIRAAGGIQHGIPSTQIRPAVQRYLCPEPPERESITQSPNNPDLPCVSKWIAIGVEPEGWDEPDRDAKPTDLLQADVAEQPALESIELAR
jgi:hypothetical protein